MSTASLKNDEYPAPPVHVAIIMDGNGRWAQARGLPRTAGHKRGAESVRRAVTSAIRNNVKYLTLFGFSSENWSRPAEEVRDLMGLLRFYLKSEIKALHKEGVQVRVIGERARLDSDIVALIESSEAMTRANNRLVLTVALSYGGRAELVRAAQKIAAAAVEGRLKLDEIDENAVSAQLFTADIPDPDLLIRTSGEQRISNFMLWQCAYTEFAFIDTLWPDFSEQDFAAAIKDFQTRERRFGAT